MSIIREFTLYLHAGITTPEVIHANQYSQGETWIFKLLQDDGSAYVPSTGALIGVKADGHAIAGLTGTVLGDGRVSITTTQQLTAAAGDATCELTIDGGTNGSANFVIRVEKKPTDDAILSESDLSIIQEGMNSVTPVVIAETVSDWLEENFTEPPVDPTLSISNAAADAKVTGDKITELKTEIQQDNEDLGKTLTIINRFDKTKAVTGRIGNAGVDTTVTNEFASDYIDVSDIDGIVLGRFVNNAWSETNCYYVLYDELKSRIGSREVGKTIDTSQAHYIRFSGQNDYINVFMAVASGYTPTQYVAYSRVVTFSYVDNAVEAEGATKYTIGRIGEIGEENTKFFTFTDNRLDLTQITENKFLDGYGELVNSETTDVSDYCYVGDLSTVYLGRFRNITTYDTLSQYCFLYDADKNKISSRLTIPTTGLDISSYHATYMRCNLPHSSEYSLVLVPSAPSAYVPFGYNFKYAQHDALYGKKWAVCGDSFSWGGYSPMNVFADGLCYGKRKVYPYYIRQRTGIEIYDFTLGGRTLAYPADGTFANSLTNPSADWYYQNIPADSDYITIYLGINDLNHANGYGETPDGEDATGVITLGTIDDVTTATYYGAWNVVLTWLITNRPFAHIGIIVTNGTQSRDFTEAQINIAKKYGIPYINLNGDERTPAMIRCYNPNIPAEIKSAITAKQRVSESNTHPNDAAHEYESHFIENFLRSI